MDDGAESPKRPLGFQDFMTPSKTGRKKRTLPIAPQRRNRGEGEEEGEGEGMYSTMYTCTFVYMYV